MVFVSGFEGPGHPDNGGHSANWKPAAISVDAGVLLPGHAGHFVAVLDSNEAETTIADPLKGKVVLSRADLGNRYDFTGFFLVFGKQTLK